MCHRRAICGATVNHRSRSLSLHSASGSGSATRVRSALPRRASISSSPALRNRSAHLHPGGEAYTTAEVEAKSSVVPRLPFMNVFELLTTDTTAGALCVTEKATVHDAARVIRLNNGYSVTVVDSEQRVLGIMTERDYLRKLIVAGKSPYDTPVTEIMTPSPRMVRGNNSLCEIVLHMVELNARHMPVVGQIRYDGSFSPEGDQLIGVISAFQVIEKLNLLSDHLEFVNKSVHAVLEEQKDRGARLGRPEWWPTLKIDVGLSVFDGIVKMAENNVGRALVMDKGVVVGLLTEGHYLHKLGDRDAREVKITEIMSSRFESLMPENTVRDCLRLLSEKRRSSRVSTRYSRRVMQRSSPNDVGTMSTAAAHGSQPRRLRHLLVFDDAACEHCVGIISVKDILRALCVGVPEDEGLDDE